MNFQKGIVACYLFYVCVFNFSDYYEKQIFQNTIFPAGLGYDSKKEHYRTPEINSVIGGVAQLSKGFWEIKKPNLSKFEEKSGLVQGKVTLSNQINSYLAKIDNLKHIEMKPTFHLTTPSPI